MNDNREPSSLHQFFTLNSKLKQYQKGNILIKPSDSSMEVFLIEKGFVEVRSEKHADKLYAIYKPGELFPLLWALQGVQKRFIYKAYTDCAVRIVPKDIFTRIISTDLGIAQEVIQHLAIYCDMFLERIDNLEVAKAYDRVVSRLLFFAKRFGRKKKNDIILAIPMTHDAIADSLSIRRETTSRIMKRLKDEGLIQYAHHQITLKNKLLITSLFASI